MINNGSGPSLLEMREISKDFSGINVLSEVMFSLRAGETHVLAGENGAGKSTLIKILGGVYRDYGGTIYLNSVPCKFTSVMDAARAGISVIHQELSLIPQMSVLDNLFLGDEKSFDSLGLFLDHRKQAEEAEKILAPLGLEHLYLDTPVERLPLSTCQMLEIARALKSDCKVLVMDEPTSTLSAAEAEKLFTIIGTLKKRGVGIVYISHKMEEIYRLGDRITVLRDGRHIGTAEISDLPQDKLINWMVGRPLGSQFPLRPEKKETPAISLKVENLAYRPQGTFAGTTALADISFELHEGEILGIAGVQGSGNSDLLNAVFGSYSASGLSGKITLCGKIYAKPSPAASLNSGLALLTNDRKRSGTVPEMTIDDNITLAALRAYCSGPGGLWTNAAKESSAAGHRFRELDIRATSGKQTVGTLSGGNQQKVLLARWLETQPRVLLLDEPTRGVDVAVKHEIYNLINRLTEQGVSVLLITSEMPELIAMSDRIIVMHRGWVSGELKRSQFSQETILSYAMGTVRTE